MSDLSNISFWFDFRSDGTGLKQIDEPVGFDAVDLTVKQRDDGMGRDVFFTGSNEAKYSFTNTKNKYGFEFDRLVEYDNIYGSESEIGFVIRIDNDDFILGDLDFAEKDTDQYSFFDCNVIVSTKQALVKRKYDTKVDLFSDEDLNGDYIEPVQTYNILVPAKPIIRASEWNTQVYERSLFGAQTFTESNFFNSIRNTVQYDIDNSLSYAFTEGWENHVYIDAIDDLTEVVLEITDVNLRVDVGENTLGTLVRIGYYIGTTASVDPTNDYTFFNVFGDAPITINDYNQAIELPNIPSGFKLWISFQVNVFPFVYYYKFDSGNFKITATARSVDTVTKGVRWKDTIQQVAKSINPDFTFTMPRFEVGGEHYDNFIVDGNMLRNRPSPLVIPFSENIDHLNTEVNCDYEVGGDSMFVGHQSDFYPNYELASFLIKPDSTFGIRNNPNYLINEFNSKYKKYNQDKDEENTIDAVHTEMETLTPYRNSETTKKLEYPWSRDPFLIAFTQKKASSETSSSLTEDDQKFILDCTQIAPTQRGTLIRRMTHYIDAEGNLLLLGNGFNWTILGFQVGDDFEVLDTFNVGTYTVADIQINILTLTPENAIPFFPYETITTVEYPLTDVDYIFRTNEGFDLIEGVESPDEYGNLRYTIKRNILNYWGEYLATSTYWRQEDIRVTYFKNNVNLTTQYDGGAVINERDNITQEQLGTPLLTPRMIFCKVLATMDEFRQLQTDIKRINDDNTKGGFIRVCGNNGEIRKGFVQKASYSPENGTIDLELEEKYEDIYTTITRNGGIYVINEVGYDSDILPYIDYRTNNDYIQIFDLNTRPLTRSIRYDFVKVDGVAYDDINQLTAAIEAL